MADSAHPSAEEVIALCKSGELQNSGEAVPFDVLFRGRTCRAFAIRFEDQSHAYVNECAHVAMEMDFQPNQFFDSSGQWLMCATHGAMYDPASGACAGGPCRGGLEKIALTEHDGVVHWHTAQNLKAIEF